MPVSPAEEFRSICLGGFIATRKAVTGTGHPVTPWPRASSRRGARPCRTPVMLARSGQGTAFGEPANSSAISRASGKIASAPASRYRRARATASSNPVTPRASVRAMMTKSRSASRRRRPGSSPPSRRARPQFPRKVPAPFGHFLVFEMNPRDTGRLEQREPSVDVHRLAEARVRVAKQRQRCGLRGEPGASVHELGEREQADIRHAVSRRKCSARKIHRPEAHAARPASRRAARTRPARRTALRTRHREAFCRATG